MPTDAPYSISDLARLTGISVRTIRYYLAQGLIPASGESGPGAHYGEGHLGRLRLVRRLQQEHLPLAEIRARLASLSDTDVLALVSQEPTATSAPRESALDYVRSVLAGSGRGLPPAQLLATQATPLVPPPPAMPPMRDTPPRAPLARRVMEPLAMELRKAAAETALPLASAVLPSDLQSPAIEPAPGGLMPSAIERSQWERLSLGPNLELHVRRPLGRLEQKRVERLITIARQVLKEEQP